MNPMRLHNLALLVALLAFNPAALTCGGGGSGSYRKPPRPGQLHQHSAAPPSTQQGATAPQGAPQ
ncbi:MAG: hypothetical protein ACKO7Z_11280 [Cyanobacteriota bacterium]